MLNTGPQEAPPAGGRGLEWTRQPGLLRPQHLGCREKVFEEIIRVK